MHEDVQVEDGLFNVMLGGTNPLPDGLFEAEELWLGITVETDPEISPRLQLTSSPYAFRAAIADSVAGGVVGADGDWTITGNDMHAAVTGNVGIGSDNPIHKLQVCAGAEGTAAFERYLSNGSGPSLIFQKARGSASSPSQVVVNDVLGGYNTYAYDGTGFATTGRLRHRVESVSEDDEIGSYLEITTTNEDGTVIEAMRIKGDGVVGIGTTNPNERLTVQGVLSLDERFSPPTASSGYGKVYVKSSDSRLYFKNDGGTEYDLLAGGGIGGSGTTNYFARFTGSTSIGVSAMYQNGGDIGIGTTGPSAKLDVVGTGTRAGEFQTGNASSNTHVLHAEYTGTGTSNATAVYGESTPSDGHGIGGYFEGGLYGVRAVVSSSGTAIVSHMGIRASATGGSGYNYGVFGSASGSGTTNYGVYGEEEAGGTGAAGYFWGDVEITGNLTGGKGGSKIDHPLDPEHKYLQHNWVESSDMMNIYNGNVLLDRNGEAWVELPDWFEALNRDFRYQLTCIGGFAPVYVGEKISGGRFRIAGGSPDMEISWQVTGIRQDAFARQNPLEVETEKQAQERGKYLHPEAWGFARTRSVNYREGNGGGD